MKMGDGSTLNERF